MDCTRHTEDEENTHRVRESKDIINRRTGAPGSRGGGKSDLEGECVENQ